MACFGHDTDLRPRPGNWLAGFCLGAAGAAMVPNWLGTPIGPAANGEATFGLASPTQNSFGLGFKAPQKTAERELVSDAGLDEANSVPAALCNPSAISPCRPHKAESADLLSAAGNPLEIEMGDVIQLRDYNPKIKEAPEPQASVDLLYGVDLIAAYHAVYPKSIDDIPWPGMDSANYVADEKDPA
jgi:hypothetical protein